MTRGAGFTVTLMAAARVSIIAAASDALPRETGGILLGWRGGGAHEGCTVIRALEVPDASSSRISYERNSGMAEQAMQVTLRAIADPDIGYVGEWHSHPKNQTPSRQDRSSIRGTAHLVHGPVALVVPSLRRADPSDWEWHALVASRRSRIPGVTVGPAKLLHRENQ